MPPELFDGIDLTLPDETLAEWLAFVLDRRTAEIDGEVVVDLSAEELEMIIQWARSAGPKVRAILINHLFWSGPCEWSDIESWILDKDFDIRQSVTGDIEIFGELSVGGRLCISDPARCIGIIGSAVERYPDTFMAIWALRDLAMRGGEWLRSSWQEANRLLDLNNIDINTQIICAYFEDIITDLNWGPNDPHIRSWIKGTDGWRQIILLRVAAYQGLNEGRLREIVEALTHSSEPEIAERAKGVLSGRLKYGDI